MECLPRELVRPPPAVDQQIDVLARVGASRGCQCPNCLNIEVPEITPVVKLLGNDEAEAVRRCGCAIGSGCSGERATCCGEESPPLSFSRTNVLVFIAGLII